MKIFLGDHQSLIDDTINNLNDNKIIKRIWQKDHTVWSNDPAEISNRLGWLDCLDVTKESFSEINFFVEEIENEGFTDALLLGMGGSSLAPEVFRLTFGVQKSYLDLSVLDSTHPEAVLEYSKKLNPAKTLYIVSTKSGGTIETISFLKYFYSETVKKLGKERAREHFIAITDSGSGLEQMAKELKFRKIFLNDPDIGGRFSALSLFGIVPAALIGVDINNLFNSAGAIIQNSKSENAEENLSAKLGAVIGILALNGIDKLTFLISPSLKPIGAWLEQLIAESTGKNGKGILPVDLETLVNVNDYSNDRIFVHIKLKSENDYDEKITELKNYGFPVLEIELNDVYELASEFFRWEFAIAVAGYVMKVQPFDQPNVESAKVAARAMMKEYEEKGKLPELIPSIENDGIKIFSEVNSSSAEEALAAFLSKAEKGKSYVSIQAYLKPEEKIWNELQILRENILKKYKIATTLGYGPSFLHSTGQLHKGDGGNGLFIQLFSNQFTDAPIPDKAGEIESKISFGTLIKAQSLGDRKALVDAGRDVMRIEFDNDYYKSNQNLTNLI